MGSPIIFSGNDAKTLKANIDLFGNAKILSGSVDPTSSATLAPKGSIYLNTSTGFTYRHTTSVSDTNWVILSSNNTGDLAEGSFSAANNTATQTITGFAFSNTTIRSFEALVSVFIDATADSFESFRILGVQRSADWLINVSSVGSSGTSFTITNAGQMQITTANYVGFVSATVKFRAITTTV